MQQFSLHKTFYHKNGIDETDYSAEAYERKKKLEHYKQLISEGCSQKTAFKVLEVPKTTYYRWKKSYDLFGLAGLENESRQPKELRKPEWTKEDEALVLKVRRIHYKSGKYKIAKILTRDYKSLITVSTVGRIISKLLKNGRIKSVGFHMGRTTKKKRTFENHAQRWTYGMKSQKPGELVQMDHATIKLDSGKVYKHFKAICPITKITAEKAYCTATSEIASEFLQFAQEQLPFKIKTIQVDGGSEFMGVFETSCKNKGIDLFVLPPRSPKFNAHVERGNGTVKYEFYYDYNGPSALSIVNLRLQEFVKYYNTFRPHQSLNYDTPMEFYEKLTNELKTDESRVKLALPATEANFQSETHTILL